MGQQKTSGLVRRPNTRVDDSLLHEKLVLCCGEDPTELMLGLPTKEAPTSYHEYRCYKFWRFESFALAWSGIGTGCLEPLLYEVLVVQPNPSIREIVLIGTAGALPPEGRVKHGHAYLIDKAYLGGSALTVPEHDISLLLAGRNVEPLRPRLGRMENEILAHQLETRSVVSSDYYYGFSKDPRSEKLRQRDKHLREAVESAWDKVEMVDMETAQFYYFCNSLGGDLLTYAAVRGPSNAVDKFHEQISFSLQVLRATLKVAFRLLALDEVVVSR
jgi:Phosphorylase superfamily